LLASITRPNEGNSDEKPSVPWSAHLPIYDKIISLD